MKSGTIGVILLAVGSVVLGIIAGQLNYSLFKSAIPPVAMSQLNQVTAKGAALTYGLISGVALFVWSLVAVFVSPVFRRK